MRDDGTAAMLYTKFMFVFFFSMGGGKIYMNDSEANCRYVIDYDFTV